MSVNNVAYFLTDHKTLPPEGPTTRCLKYNWWASAIVFGAQGLSSKQRMKLGIKQSNHACLCRHTCPTCSPLQRANRMHELTFHCERQRLYPAGLVASGCVSLHTSQVDVLSHNQAWPIFFMERRECVLIHSLKQVHFPSPPSWKMKLTGKEFLR